MTRLSLGELGDGAIGLCKLSDIMKNCEPVKPDDRQRWIASLFGYELMLESEINDVDLGRWCSTLKALLDLYDRTFLGIRKYPSYNQAFPLGPGTVEDSRLAILPRLLTGKSWNN